MMICCGVFGFAYVNFGPDFEYLDGKNSTEKKVNLFYIEN